MAKQALEGVKVVSFAIMGVGPLTIQYLADHGATVVQVETHTHVQVIRTSSPFKDGRPGIDGAGLFNSWNTSKMGISLDVSKPKGKEIAQSLIKWADIMIESYSPGAMGRLGLDYESVKKLKPDIIYMSTSMLGQYGPDAAYRGWGQQAASLGLSYDLSGWPDRDGPAPPHGAYTDFVSPPFGAAALLAALDYRRRTGKGTYLDQSQTETSLHFFAPPMMDYMVNGRVDKRDGNRCPSAAPHGVYRCQGQDRWCAFTVFSDKDWLAFCRCIGRPQWTKDPRFATLMKRKENEDELDKLVEAWTVEHKAEEVETLLQAAGIPASIAEDARDIWEDPQVKHRGYFRMLKHEILGEMPAEGPPFKLSRTPDRQFASPLLGQHNEYVYKEILKLSDDEIADLLVDRVITTEADMPLREFKSWR